MSVGARIGWNETIFREVNDRINELNRGFAVGAADLADFICECSDARCFAPLRLSLAEYEQVRGNPTHFVLALGHGRSPEAERIVGATDRYEIVVKLRDAADVADEADRRRWDVRATLDTAARARSAPLLRRHFRSGLAA